MNEWVEFSAKTVDDALTEALIKLELTSDMVEYEVIESEKAGFLGMFSRPAKIRVRKKEKKAAEPVKTAKKEQTKAEKKEYSEKKVKTERQEKPEVTGDVEGAAKKFLNDVFKAMNIEAEVTVVYDASEGQVSVNIEGEDMGILIGKRGQTLDSLQYLTSLVVNKESSSYLKVKVDTENYRERRKVTLENLAKNISYKVKRTKRSVSLEPMNPYERRIIHSALQNDKYVETHSEGEEPYRRVVVTLKKGYRDYQGRSNHGKSSYSNNRGGYRKNFTSDEEVKMTEE
ncbi:MAG: RNA-binding cell elongation regulator Jag/EloR [Acetivibrio ethanolgignens]